MHGTSAIIALAGLLIAASAAATAEESQVRVLPWLKLEDLSATRDRPLFAQNRRPPPPPAVVIPSIGVPQKEEEAPEAKPNLSLRGIIRQDASTLVVLEDNATSQSIVVRSGESYGRWRVTAESDDSVRLADESEELRLKLFQP